MSNAQGSVKYEIESGTANKPGKSPKKWEAYQVSGKEKKKMGAIKLLFVTERK